MIRVDGDGGGDGVSPIKAIKSIVFTAIGGSLVVVEAKGVTIVRSTTGTFIVSFDTAFSSANYLGSGIADIGSSSTQASITQNNSATTDATQFAFYISISTSTLTDPQICRMSFMELV